MFMINVITQYLLSSCDTYLVEFYYGYTRLTVHICRAHSEQLEKVF